MSRALERFDASYDLDPDSGCWLWSARTDHRGYGIFSLGRRRRKAHRAAWELYVGPIPKGRGYHGTVVRHAVCGNPACVNPEHLRLGSNRDNQRDKARDGTAAGERNGNAKLTWERVKEIRGLLASGVPHRKIAKRFGVCPSLISHINTGKSWTMRNQIRHDRGLA